MKVKDLIDKLNNLNPELQVRLVADHGQTAMTCSGVFESYIQEDEYMAEEIHSDDLCGDEIKVAILEAF